MGAREKLNVSHINGSLFLAALVGWLAQSWSVFVLALVILIALDLYAGHVRPRPRRPGRAPARKGTEGEAT